MQRHAVNVFLTLLSFAVEGSAQTPAPSASVVAGPERRLAPYRVSAAEPPDQGGGVIKDGDGLLAVGWARRLDGTVYAVMTAIDRNGRRDTTRERRIEPSRWYLAESMGKKPLLLWRDEQRGWVISLLRLDGTLERPDGIVLGIDRWPGVACNATHCVLTAPPFYGGMSKATIIDAALRVVARVVVPQSTSPLAVDPDGFLLRHYEANIRNEPTELHLLRIGNDGTIAFDHLIPRASDVAADFDGNAYTVVHGERDLVVARQVGLDGRIGPPHVAHRVAQYDNLAGLAIGWNGTTHLLTFGSGSWAGLGFEGVLPDASLYGVRLTGSLEVLDETPRLISDLPTRNTYPEVHPFGSGFYVTWAHQPYSFVSAPYRMFGTFVDADGNARPHESLLSGPISQQPVAVAATDSQFLAVWQENDTLTQRPTVRAARIASGGAALDVEPLTITDPDARDVRGVAAAAAGSDYLVAWTEAMPARSLEDEWGHYRSVAAAIVHGDGTVEQLKTNYFDGDPWNSWVGVASDGDGWLLASGSYGKTLRVTRTGLLTKSANYSYDGPAALASNGDGFLVVASDWFKCSNQCVYALPLKSDGTEAAPARGPFPLSVPSMYSMAMASNGRDYLALGYSGDSLEAIRFSATGTVLGGPFTVVRFPGEGARTYVERRRFAVCRLGSGWLVTSSAGHTRSATRISGDGTIEDLPAFDSAPITALAPTSETSVIAIGGQSIDDAVAAVWQELVASPDALSPGRRRSSAH
jgi:hypothetical protein